VLGTVMLDWWLPCHHLIASPSFHIPPSQAQESSVPWIGSRSPLVRYCLGNATYLLDVRDHLYCKGGSAHDYDIYDITQLR